MRIFKLVIYACVLIVMSCGGQKNETETSNVTGKPEDKYACNINTQGYCIFTGTPHKTGLKSNTNDIIDRAGNTLFTISDAAAANSSQEVLKAKGTPAADGDDFIKYSQDGMTDDEKAFHRVMAIMFPIRNALMYDIADLTQDKWNEFVTELEKRNIKETTYTDGSTPKDNYYGRQGIFDLAKSPGGKDIHHEVMKFLEESSIFLLCHVTSDIFNKMLEETHPEGHDVCGQLDISTKIPF